MLLLWAKKNFLWAAKLPVPCNLVTKRHKRPQYICCQKEKNVPKQAIKNEVLFTLCTSCDHSTKQIQSHLFTPRNVFSIKTIGFVVKRALNWWSYCCFSPRVPQAQSGCQKSPHAGAFFSNGNRECVCRWSSCPRPETSRWWGSPESYTRPEPGSTFHI